MDMNKSVIIYNGSGDKQNFKTEIKQEQSWPDPAGQVVLLLQLQY